MIERVLTCDACGKPVVAKQGWHLRVLAMRVVPTTGPGRPVGKKGYQWPQFDICEDCLEKNKVELIVKPRDAKP
jgi:hypothetical protein